jgi:hypothetical protein
LWLICPETDHYRIGPGSAGNPSPQAVPITPADRTGACVDCFPVHSAFPVIQAGRHPRLHFRPARTSLTLRPARSLSHPRRPLSRGSSPSGYPAEPLVSYQINRQLSGWNLPPLVIRAVGAHRIIRDSHLHCRARNTWCHISRHVQRTGSVRIGGTLGARISQRCRRAAGRICARRLPTSALVGGEWTADASLTR